MLKDETYWLSEARKVLDSNPPPLPDNLLILLEEFFEEFEGSQNPSYHEELVAFAANDKYFYCIKGESL